MRVPFSLFADRLAERVARLEQHPRSSPPIWEERPYAISEPLPPIQGLLANAVGPDRRAWMSHLRHRFASLGDTKPAAALHRLADEQVRCQVETETAPTPVPADREGYYGEQHVDYWASGYGDAVHLRDLLQEFHGHDSLANARTLDLGCSSGRVVRHLLPQLPTAQIHGCDINRNNIRWMRAHLDARLTAFQNTVLPQLPLPDASLDLVCAYSVFTHIDDYEEGWLLELRRVLRPGGIAYLTFHSEHTWEQMQHEWHFMLKFFTTTPQIIEELPGATIARELFETPMPHERLVFVGTGYPINNTNVFHSHAHVQSRWGQYFQLARIERCAHGEHQDGAVLVKA
jgi:SAM-dependent methyltransferase